AVGPVCTCRLDQGGDGWLDRIAMRDDEADRVENLRLHEPNGAQCVGQFNGVESRIGDDACPLADAYMRHQRAQGVGFQYRRCLDANTSKNAVDYAAALQVAAKKAQRGFGGLSPGDAICVPERTRIR